jgi:hypothetical protein
LVQKPFRDFEFSKAKTITKDRVNGVQPPVKPSNAYCLWQKNKRAETPKVKLGGKKIAKYWHALTKEEKQPFKDAACK